MNNNFNNKLIIFLKYKYKNNKILSSDKDYNEFLSYLSKNRIDEELVTYLFNYLYRFSSNNKIGILYKNHTIYLYEVSDSYNKYSVIRPDKTNIDIERTSVVITNNTVKKTNHLSLDSNVDFVVKETRERKINSNEDMETIVSQELSDNNYYRISVINKDNPIMYRTKIIGQSNYVDTIIVDDKIVGSDYIEDVSDLRDNITYYTRMTYKDLMQGYAQNKLNNFDLTK